MTNKNKILFVLGVAIAGIALVSWAPWSTGYVESGDVPEFEVQNGDLVIDVLEGGNIHALEYLEITNDVRSESGIKILEIIEEGYEITDQDVADGKVLVRLDSSGIEEDLVDHDVEFQDHESSYGQARQNLEIEESESLSEVKLVRQALRFALLDFQKFVGEKAAREVLQSLNLPYDINTIEQFESDATNMILASFDTQQLMAQGDADEPEDPFTGDAEESRAAEIDFLSLLNGDQLGEGEAEQTMRRMQDEALLAKTELAVVEESVEGAKRLHEKEFITTQTLENEKVGLEKAKLALQTAETDMELFRDYEFPKEAEKMLSVYEEALLELVREKREAIATVARAQAQYRAAKRRYELELKQRQELEEQLASCTIRAEKPGLVAYGGANENYYTSRYYESISEGATLKRGQPIITIPNMSKLGVDVDIHESHIKKIQLGQRALITADSESDKTLEGKVSKVAVLPDSNASRYNPSLKVYPATIEIDGTHEFLKPGMTAKVKIIVNELSNVTFIPVQAVFVEEDMHYVFLKKNGRYEPVPVTIGEHNEEFIEIVDGVKPGETVALKTPAFFEESPMETQKALARYAKPDERATAKKTVVASPGA